MHCLCLKARWLKLLSYFVQIYVVLGLGPTEVLCDGVF